MEMRKRVPRARLLKERASVNSPSYRESLCRARKGAQSRPVQETVKAEPLVSHRRQPRAASKLPIRSALTWQPSDSDGLPSGWPSLCRGVARGCPLAQSGRWRLGSYTEILVPKHAAKNKRQSRARQARAALALDAAGSAMARPCAKSIPTRARLCLKQRSPWAPASPSAFPQSRALLSSPRCLSQTEAVLQLGG